MNLEKVKISSLVFDPSNVRKHNEKNLRSIKGSLAKFKQQKPIVVDKNNVVVAGNGTLQMALDLGWTEIFIVRTDLVGADATAFAIADNRTSELAEWDIEPLKESLKSLKDSDYDLESLGWGFDDLDKEFLPDLPDEGDNIKDTRMTVTIVCSSFDEQQELFDELNGRGFKVKI